MENEITSKSVQEDCLEVTISSLPEKNYHIRKALMSDVSRIKEMVDQYSAQNVMLPKSLNQLYQIIRDFTVIEKDHCVIACGGLHFYWNDLAEVISLAVDEQHKGQGYGKILVTNLLKEAKTHHIKRVFTLTLEDQFFAKLDFQRVEHEDLPQKVYKDCIQCPKLGRCNEIAMIHYL